MIAQHSQTFYLLDDSPPLIVGLDIFRHARADFLWSLFVLTFRLPSDDDMRQLPIYERDTSNLSFLAHVDMLFATARMFMASNSSVPRTPSLVNRLH